MAVEKSTPLFLCKKSQFASALLFFATLQLAPHSGCACALPERIREYVKGGERELFNEPNALQVLSLALPRKARYDVAGQRYAGDAGG